MKLETKREGLYVPDYPGEIAKCQNFITTFQDPTITRANEDPIHGKLKYMTQLQKIANKQSEIIEIELDDIQDFFDSAKDQGFVERVRTNTKRYIQLFSDVIDQHMPQPSIVIAQEDMSSFDIVMQQRRFNAANARQAMIAQGIIKVGQTT